MAPPRHRPRALVVSHACVLAVNQLPYARLVERGWDVHLVTPARWPGQFRAGGRAEVHPSFEGRVTQLDVVKAGAQQRHAYRGSVGGVLDRLQPEVVIIEEEPFSVAALQWGVAAHRRSIPFGVQAAENLRRRFPRPVERWRTELLRRAGFVMARSAAAARRAHEWGAVGRVELVPHAVPDWHVPVRKANTVFTVGYAGRLVAEKGLDTLTGALRQMAAPARLLIAGDGPLRSEVEMSAAEGVSVEVRSGLHHDEMNGVFAEMDVLCLPSRSTPTWEEQFGRVLVEALSMGTPVVGSSSGEIPWVIGLTGGGMVFAEDDVDSLGVQLERLREPGVRAGLGRRGQERVGALFSVDAVADRLEALIAEDPKSRRPDTLSGSRRAA